MAMAFLASSHRSKRQYAEPAVKKAAFRERLEPFLCEHLESNWREPGSCSGRVARTSGRGAQSRLCRAREATAVLELGVAVTRRPQSVQTR